MRNGALFECRRSRTAGWVDANVGTDADEPRSRCRMSPGFRLARTIRTVGYSWAVSSFMHALATFLLGSTEPGIVAQPAFMSSSLRW